MLVATKSAETTCYSFCVVIQFSCDLCGTKHFAKCFVCMCAVLTLAAIQHSLGFDESNDSNNDDRKIKRNLLATLKQI